MINLEKHGDYFKGQSLINPTEPLYRNQIINDIKNNTPLKTIRKKYYRYDKTILFFSNIYKKVKGR